MIRKSFFWKKFRDEQAPSKSGELPAPQKSVLIKNIQSVKNISLEILLRYLERVSELFRNYFTLNEFWSVSVSDITQKAVTSRHTYFPKNQKHSLYFASSKPTTLTLSPIGSFSDGSYYWFLLILDHIFSKLIAFVSLFVAKSSFSIQKIKQSTTELSESESANQCLIISKSNTELTARPYSFYWTSQLFVCYSY